MKVPGDFAVELYATCRGSGPPVVLIHGLLGSGSSWQNIAQRLAPYLTVYCVDLRNHGKSPHDDAFNYSVMAADLKAFLQRLGLSKAALIGHSMGGKVAMRLASASPESVASLVVLDMAPKPYGTENKSILKCLLRMDLSGFDRQKQVFEKMSALIPDDALCNLGCRSNCQILSKSLAGHDHRRFALASYRCAEPAVPNVVEFHHTPIGTPCHRHMILGDFLRGKRLGHYFLHFMHQVY